MLKILRQIVQEVLNERDVFTALDTIVRQVRDALETQACSIFLIDHDRQEFVLMATRGMDQAAVGKLRTPLTQGLIGLICEKEEALNVENAREHASYLHVPALGEEIYASFLGVPVQYRRRMLGVLIVEQEEERKFDESEEAFLVTLAAQLASVLAHAEEKGALNFNSLKEERDVLQGTPGAFGVAIGESLVVYPLADLDALPDQTTEELSAEVVAFHHALNKTKNELRVLGARLSKHLPEEERLLFDAYVKMLDSDSLVQGVTEKIQKEKLTAASALKQIIHEHVQTFKAMDNEYLQERAEDVKDLGQRILKHLQGFDAEDREYAENTVLVGNEISAANLAEVPSGRLVGVISGRGSRNSHIAILARALGVPCVMGVGELNLNQVNAKVVVVDGYLGQAFISPDAATLAKFETLAAEERALDEALSKQKDSPAQTRDGYRIQLCVNTGLMADLGQAITSGAEGVGLYRTEVPFMTRDRFPSGEEQREIYRQLLGIFAPRPVIMRLLDIGGDKTLPYFPFEEDNPFLGWRGIRILLEHPEILLTQIKAMLKASEGFHNLRIILPMITDVTEVDEVLSLFHKAYQEVCEEDALDIQKPLIGAMIEVPSMVYQTKSVSQRVDFVSVGTNDLVQYILAVDRNNPRVANLYDALHPAVLKALQQVVQEAHSQGVMASVCGEMASDPVASLLLLGMGFDMLSVNAPVLPRIKWVIRQVTMSRARKLVSEVLVMQTAKEIRRYLEMVLEELGLGALIRSGKKV